MEHTSNGEPDNAVKPGKSYLPTKIRRIQRALDVFAGPSLANRSDVVWIAAVDDLAIAQEQNISRPVLDAQFTIDRAHTAVWGRAEGQDGHHLTQLDPELKGLDAHGLFNQTNLLG